MYAGYCSSVRGTGLAASADARSSAEYEEQLTGGVVLAIAEALAVEGEEVLLAAVFAPPQAARNRGRTTAMVPHRTMLLRSEKVFGVRAMGPPHNVGVVMYCAPLYLQI